MRRGGGEAGREEPGAMSMRLVSRMLGMFQSRTQVGVDKADNRYFTRVEEVDGVIEWICWLNGQRKKSPTPEEQSIFNCMISNLFEEYKFFLKYPDKQLKLAVVLFGSLIKHQLVAHLGLGIALRAVLDALRKSVDSKMFMFGTTLLEQFMDRVIEWPQYCNHILQISHLQGTHTEMVFAIERALARISPVNELMGRNRNFRNVRFPREGEICPTKPRFVRLSEVTRRGVFILRNTPSQ